MKKTLTQKIKIPEGVEVSIDEGVLTVKGKVGENKREFNVAGLEFEKKCNEIIIGHKKASKNEKKRINTTVAHIKNLIKGVQEKFEYKLKVCSSHFPMTVDIKGNEATIKNFLGEKISRKVKIVEGSEVVKDGNFLTVTSVDKELAGQTAANFEKATKIRDKDRRIFQDGVFIINKAGKDM